LAIGPMEATQRWLQAHRSTHTQRKYDSVIQQFCEWCLLHGRSLLDAQVCDVEEYLNDLQEGRLDARERSAGVPRAAGTMLLALSVLRSLFECLIEHGLRSSNPARQAAWTAKSSRIPERQRESQTQLNWLEIREHVIAQARSSTRERDPLWRAIVIAEFATWAGLRRSELAAAAMGDFVLKQSRWKIRVHRFGHDKTEEIDLPSVTMEALGSYRASRGLPVRPLRAEIHVPLIARVRTERGVNSWTVANALARLALAFPEAAEGSPPSIVAMRRAAAARALQAHVPQSDIGRHLRSRRIFECGDPMAPFAVVEVLDRLSRGDLPSAVPRFPQ